MIQNFFTIGNTKYDYLFPETFELFQNKDYQNIYNTEVNRLVENKLLVCPKCHNNLFNIHSNYFRYIIDTPQQQINNEYHSLYIIVVHCRYCNTYHAILPAFIPAFSHYSYHFIFSVLAHFHKYNDLNKTCLEFSISCHLVKVFIDKVEPFFLRVMKSKLIHKLHCVMQSNRELRKSFIDFLMHFFVSEPNHPTLIFFFGRPIYISIIIPNQNEP